MNGNVAFNIEKLNDVVLALSSFTAEYKETIRSLELEITKLGKVWGDNDSDVYLAFKEKYDEKKTKLVEVENLIGELSSQLYSKKEELENVTRKTINTFE